LDRKIIIFIYFIYNLLLQSPQPDFVHFLHDRLAPEETLIISKEYGQQLEFTADYPAALLHYERGILAHFRDFSLQEVEEHNLACRAGIAR
jgi:WD repeat-containing protein 19